MTFLLSFLGAFLGVLSASWFTSWRLRVAMSETHKMMEARMEELGYEKREDPYVTWDNADIQFTPRQESSS